MFPRITVDDGMNGGSGNAVLSGEPLHAVGVAPCRVPVARDDISASMATPDLADLIGTQSGQVVSFAMLEQEALNGIPHVLMMTASKQVGGVAARTPIAHVANYLAKTEGAVQEHEQQGVGIVALPFILDGTVSATPIAAALVSAASPRPARIEAGRLVDFRPEVVDDGLILTTPGGRLGTHRTLQRSGVTPPVATTTRRHFAVNYTGLAVHSEGQSLRFPN